MINSEDRPGAILYLLKFQLDLNGLKFKLYWALLAGALCRRFCFLAAAVAGLP